MTYGEIYEEFVAKCGRELQDQMTDYRPATELYVGVNLPMAIVVWLKDGSKIIYQTKI